MKARVTSRMDNWKACAMTPRGRLPTWEPGKDDQNMYLVVDDFGQNGRVFREADFEKADLETVIVDLLDGHYENPTMVVAFNTAKNGRRTYPRTWRMNCASAAISNSVTKNCSKDNDLSLPKFGALYQANVPLSTIHSPFNLSKLFDGSRRLGATCFKVGAQH
jgi:hypothetical protein